MLLFVNILVIAVAAILLVAGFSDARNGFLGADRVIWPDVTDVAGTVAGPPTNLLWNLSAESLLWPALALIVFIFYIWRFQSWAEKSKQGSGIAQYTTRFFTTFFNYYAWATMYAMISVAAFAIFSMVPDAILLTLSAASIVFPAQFISDMLDQYNQIVQKNIGQNEDIMLMIAAFVVVMGFATTPLDTRLRLALQRNAQIPKQAERIEKKIRSNLFAGEIPAEQIDDFLTDTQFALSHPIAPFELSTEMRDQRFLEPYARAEFLLWRLRHGGFGERIDRALADHEATLQKIDGDLAEVRAAISGYSQMIDRALRHMPDPEPPADGDPSPGSGLSRTAVAILERAGLPELAQIDLEDRSQTLKAPVSKFDDIMRAMYGCLDSIGPGLEEFIRLALESMEEGLKAARKKLDGAIGELVRLAVCIALYAEKTPSYDFLRALGLRPRASSVRFHPETAFATAFSVAVVYLVVLALLDGMSEQGRIPFDVQLGIWLVTGLLFIFVPIVHGAFHGAIMARRRSDAAGGQKPDGRFTIADFAYAFVLTGAALIVAMFLLSRATELNGPLFRGASMFAAVAAIWGACAARATMRALLETDPVRGWREPAEAVGYVLIALALVWAAKGAPTPQFLGFWLVIPTIAVLLTLVLFAALSRGAERNQADGPATQNGGPVGLAPAQ